MNNMWTSLLGWNLKKSKFVKHTFEVKGIYYGMLEFQAPGTAW